MQTHYEVAVVTLLAILVYVWMGVSVGGARSKSGIAAPAMTGDPMLERYLRVQGNTLEWLPIFLPALWLFALYWNDRIAALVGLVWIVGRIAYALGYWADAAKREMGFMIQSAAAAVLVFGALGKIIWTMVSTGSF
jgi:glutathione S-transferase